MNIFGINSRILALALVAVAGNVMGSEKGGNKDKKQESPKFVFTDPKGTARRMGEGSYVTIPQNMFLAGVNKGINSPLGQSTAATVVNHTIPSVKILYDKDQLTNPIAVLKVLAAGATYDGGNYGTRRLVDAASDRVGGLNGVAKKCDILPEQLPFFGYKVRDNVNPMVKGVAEFVAPVAREAVCDNGGEIGLFLATAALKYIKGSLGGGSISTGDHS